MAKRSRAGFPGPNGAGRGNLCAWPCCKFVYICTLRGMIRLVDGGLIGCRFAPARAGMSFYAAGVGRLQRRSVLSLVPGIREPPSVRDLLAGRREKEGRPIMAPGVRPYRHHATTVLQMGDMKHRKQICQGHILRNRKSKDSYPGSLLSTSALLPFIDNLILSVQEMCNPEESLY